MKILYLTRGELSEWENQLCIKLNALISMGSLIQRSIFFVLGIFSEEVAFYRKLPQSKYWKERIYHDYPFPKWLGSLPLQFLKRFYKPPKAVYDYLLKEKPDLVVCSTLMLMPQYADHDLAIVAKELGIPLVGIVPTWDSLVTKTKIQVVPDLIFCWNETHKQELIQYHGIKEDTIRCVGPYTHNEILKLRSPTRKDKFFSKWGLDPNKPVATYLSSSPATVGDETEAIMALEKQVEQLIVRPHPQRGGQYYNLSKVWVIPGTTDHDFQLKYDTLYYSDMVFSINSSSFLEALLLNKPSYLLKTNFPDVAELALHVSKLSPLLKDHNFEKIREFLGVKEELPLDILAKTLQELYKL